METWFAFPLLFLPINNPTEVPIPLTKREEKAAIKNIGGLTGVVTNKAPAPMKRAVINLSALYIFVLNTDLIIMGLAYSGNSWLYRFSVYSGYFGDGCLFKAADLSLQFFHFNQRKQVRQGRFRSFVPACSIDLQTVTASSRKDIVQWLA